jgi:hypothetical protein
MKENLLKLLINAVLTFLSEAQLKDFADALLDFVEDAVEKSGTDLDDAIILPICRKVREAFGIPDND